MGTFYMTVTQSCALCSAPVDISLCTPDQYEATMAAHHAVCPKRPIAIGDYVRILSTSTGGPSGAHGVVVELNPPGDQMPYRVSIPGDKYAWWCHEVERIPRPAEAQEIELDCYVEWRPDGSRSRAAGQVVKMDGDRAIVRIREVSQTWTAFEACPFAGHARSIALAQLRRIPWPHEQPPTCAPGCQCGAHGLAAWLPVTEAAHPAVKDAGRYREQAVQSFGEPPPAPALVDGITRDACLARWMENRLAVEGGAAPPNAMTRMQRDVGRAMWLQRVAAPRAAWLRAKVAAGREAERNRVRVDLEVQPWD